MKQYILFALALVTLATGCEKTSNVESPTLDEKQKTNSSFDVVADERLNDVNFSETGNITDWDEVTETYVDDWTLTYELPGVPASSVDLVFDDDSVCVVANEEYDCRDILDKEFNGKRLHVQGVRDDTQVSVKRITF